MSVGKKRLLDGLVSTQCKNAQAMFVEIKVCYSALFTNLVGWYAGAVSFPLSDVILAQLACPLSDLIFCLHSGITSLSLYKHCAQAIQIGSLSAQSSLVLALW
jgi:hypothetical protein